MNLRQKVKHAKKELAILDKKNTKHMFPIDLYLHVTRCGNLRELIDFKKKPSRGYRFNEECDVDVDNLTSICMIVEGQIVSSMTSPNGKAFSKATIDEFIRNTIELAINRFGKKTANSEPQLDYFNKKRKISYLFYFSSDRTRQKRYTQKLIFTQEYGSIKLKH